MAQIDFRERQVTLKLVYYGPPLSGKTTNLAKLHGRVDELSRGRLMTLDTRDDRTLFFDLLPVFFRDANVSFRFKVYTVPGQPIHEATRRVVLQQADGVVFVADSGPDKRNANAEAWAGMIANLERLHLTKIPVVVQFNKRDVLGAVSLDEAGRFGDPSPRVMAATASRGEGVVETFIAACEEAWLALAADVPLEEKFGMDFDEFHRMVWAHVGGGST